MPKMTLKRVSSLPHATYGMLLDEVGQPICVTLEDPWLDNKKNVSCIPAGVYLCKRKVSPKHGETFEVTGVPGRSAILFHAGNWAGEPGVASGPMAGHTQGCILLGQSFGVPRIMGNEHRVGVVTSTRAVAKFMETLKEYDSFVLEVSYL